MWSEREKDDFSLLLHDSVSVSATNKIWAFYRTDRLWKPFGGAKYMSPFLRCFSFLLKCNKIASTSRTSKWQVLIHRHRVITTCSRGCTNLCSYRKKFGCIWWKQNNKPKFSNCYLYQTVWTPPQYTKFEVRLSIEMPISPGFKYHTSSPTLNPYDCTHKKCAKKSKGYCVRGVRYTQRTCSLLHWPLGS